MYACAHRLYLWLHGWPDMYDNIYKQGKLQVVKAKFILGTHWIGLDWIGLILFKLGHPFSHWLLFRGPMHIIYIYTYKIKISSRSLYEKFLSGYGTTCIVLQQIKRGLQLEKFVLYISRNLP